MLGIIRDMVYFALVYLTDMASFIFVVLFHFIIDLVGIFMMMINIKKIELTTVSKSCLSNTFFCLDGTCLPAELWTKGLHKLWPKSF